MVLHGRLSTTHVLYILIFVISLSHMTYMCILVGADMIIHIISQVALPLHTCIITYDQMIVRLDLK
jgi:hypothetical protein